VKTFKIIFKGGCNLMKVIDTIALVLIIIGAINWGLVGIFNFNLVDAIFGAMSTISRIIYILVGISGLWAIKLLFDK
jgi:hypothetical protein